MRYLATRQERQYTWVFGFCENPMPCLASESPGGKPSVDFFDLERKHRAGSIVEAESSSDLAMHRAPKKDSAAQERAVASSSVSASSSAHFPI